ncbi:zinc finger BED domain-containing protein DAYSLEEPER-like [Pistacia vera]|uniref:zinc finger BED domain-containing protein DAYSLEEPER-like n=1 Tax=Pistacia vera TaxID=55513 RepID=UPI0012632803|nr:zinc finger BED domain-containing protein DAYSLEEPER-like [Pistacia vera]
MEKSTNLGTGRNVAVGQLPSTGSTAWPKRRQVSDVWGQFATYVEDNNGKVYDLCVDQMMMDCDTKLRRLKISQEIYREKMAIGIIKHNYSYSIVEHEGIRDVHMYLNHEVKHYTRNTAKADCLKIYYREKEGIKLALERVSGRICLTFDIWHSCTTDEYISLTANYVDQN